MEPSMPWRKVSIMEQRQEFVALALNEGANRRELCRRFAISPQTGYKWLTRSMSGQELGDRSRRPHGNPLRCNAAIEATVLCVRDAHPAWGARKIARCLERDGLMVPAISTIHAILRRHGRVVPPEGTPGEPYRRFEREAPNLLWQMDFKGHMPLGDRTDCHPLTIIDDHSRYAVCLKACGNEQSNTVQSALVRTFRRYGLPEDILADNGSPWGDGPYRGWTKLGVWLLKLGIGVHHGRAYHPQTHGKNERFNRTLKDEVFALRRFQSMAEVQRALDAWRDVYNLERPHEALGQDVPASRYRPSPRPMPDHPPAVEYGDGEIVRTVSNTKAYVSFKGRFWKVPQAFCGERLAIRPRAKDGLYAICFGAHQIAQIDLTTNRTSVSHVPEQASTMSPD
jgi:transposase InsO family protein